MALTSAHPAPPLLVCRLLALALTLALASARKIPASITPISRDLYHSSDSILGEIKALVARNSDSLTVSASPALVHLLFVSLIRFLYAVSYPPLQMDTVRASNKGYSAEMFVVTFNHAKETVEDGSKIKIMLDYNPFEEDPGTAPFSEPEAQIMQELSKSFKPHIWVNVHSGMEALFMPYDHKNTTPDGAPSQLMRSLLENLNRRHFQDSCLVGSGGGAVGYLAHGTTTDYLYDIAKVPMPFTFEIYGDEKASTDDCFKMFNPVEKTTFDSH
ncbi:hypothetical protein ACQ4PT_039382 [Festuca glaucescens]